LLADVGVVLVHLALDRGEDLVNGVTGVDGRAFFVTCLVQLKRHEMVTSDLSEGFPEADRLHSLGFATELSASGT
jgi:hypothetical protein